MTPLQVYSHFHVEAAAPRPIDERTAYGFFAVLALRFVPEPTPGVLLVAGALGLAAIGRRRNR